MCVKEPEYLLIRIPTCFVPLFWSLLARLCDPAWLPSQKIGSVSLGLMHYHTIQYWLVIVENGIPSNALLDSDSGWIHTIQPESQMFCPFLSHWKKKTQEFCRPQSWCLWGHYSIALLCPNWDANEKPPCIEGVYPAAMAQWNQVLRLVPRSALPKLQHAAGDSAQSYAGEGEQKTFFGRGWKTSPTVGPR